MTTTTLDRVPADQIGQRAAELTPGRTILRVVLGAFMFAGWAAGKAWMGFWGAFAHVWAATVVGWEAAHGPSRARQIALLTAQVDDLRTANRRLGGSD